MAVSTIGSSGLDQAANTTFCTTSGNVGIGTSSPNAKLNVVAGGSATAANQVNISGGRSLGGGVFGSSGSILFTNDYWSAGYGAASISGIDSGSSGGYLGLATTTNGGGTTGSPTERMRIDSSGAFSAVIPSGSTLYPSYWCRAWVNFNGTGTVAIRASGNVTSITDNGVGDYTVNFTNAMPDTSYSNVLGCNSDLSNGAFVVVMGVASNSGVVNTKTTTALRVTTKNQSWNFTDGTELNVAVFR